MISPRTPQTRPYDAGVNERTAPIGIIASALSTDPRQTPRLARTLGFDGLLYDAYSSSLSLPELSQTGRREFRQVLAAENRQLIGLRADLGPKGFGPGADVDRLLSRLDKAMEAAAGLQAPLLCMDAGPLPEPPAEALPAPAVTPEMAGMIILPPPVAAPAPATAPAHLDEKLASHVDAALFELGRRADRYGVTVALRSDLASFAALDRALRAASCPWFGIELDPVAVLRDQWSLDETLSRLGGFVRHVRGRDGIAGSGQRTTPAIIGRGSTEWATLLSALDAAGYAGWITIDPLELADRSAAAAAGLAHLRSL